jgi:hypothetical protein
VITSRGRRGVRSGASHLERRRARVHRDSLKANWLHGRCWSKKPSNRALTSSTRWRTNRMASSCTAFGLTPVATFARTPHREIELGCGIAQLLCHSKPLRVQTRHPVWTFGRPLPRAIDEKSPDRMAYDRGPGAQDAVGWDRTSAVRLPAFGVPVCRSSQHRRHMSNKVTHL